MGYWEAHKKYGVLPWSTLIRPTIELCRGGILVTKFLAGFLRSKEQIILENAGLR